MSLIPKMSMPKTSNGGVLNCDDRGGTLNMLCWFKGIKIKYVNLVLDKLVVMDELKKRVDA